MTAAVQLEQYRPALTGHCYRMLGSVMEAEDAVQEAMLRAWKAMDKVEQQSSLKDRFGLSWQVVPRGMDRMM